MNARELLRIHIGALGTLRILSSVPVVLSRVKRATVTERIFNEPQIIMTLPTPRQATSELLLALRLITFVFMAWKALACLSNSPCPVAVVTSESMEPGFRRGDILLLWNRQRIVHVGDIPVLWFQEHKLPMVCVANEVLSGISCRELTWLFLQVHRVVATHFRPCAEKPCAKASQYILTKGDNNIAVDTQLYPDDQEYASSDDIAGVVRVAVPHVGWPIVRLNELFARPTRYTDRSTL